MLDLADLQSKKRFFDELYALDNTDEVPPDEGLLASLAALAGPRTKASSIAPHDTAKVSTISPSKSAKQFAPRSTPPISPSSKNISAPSAVTPTKIARHIDRAGATIVTSTDTPNPQLIFHGLHFYFFPNNTVNAGRRFRIQKAVQLGAAWCKTWSNDVSHVIVDRTMGYGQFLESLKIASIPAHIIIVDERYPADCIAHRSLVDHKDARYAVKGAPGTSEVGQPKALASDPSVTSLKLKPPGRAVMAQEPTTPSLGSEWSAHEPAHESQNVPAHKSDSDIRNDLKPSNITSAAETANDLDLIIDEARHLQHMPLDDEDETESRPSSSEGASVAGAESPSKRRKLDWQDKFQCMNKNTGKNQDCANAQTMALLEQMADHYTKVRDTWRPSAYRKAIATLRNHPEKVTTKEQAKRLPFIGDRLAAKIEEIAYTNHLQRLDNARAEPTDQTLAVFLKIYGVGFAQASKWIEQGYRSLDDVIKQADLNPNQRVGIEHYTDFSTRIPRDEVQRHSKVVKELVLSIDKQLTVHTMGSYRRGSADSGDIDLIITHASMEIERLRALLLGRIIPKLFEMRFLKVALATTSRKDGSKWHGASCLPDSKIWRRIDFLLVPHTELGAALIYFTGNDIFNRSLRLLASRKGMRLNQKGLYRNAMRGQGRVKISEGELIEGKDERKIFEALGVPWRPAHHRIC